MADTYVLVHGAWHTGAEMEAVAGHLRKNGHVVHCPTVAGNNKDDDREKTGLEQAISSIVAYIEANNLRDIRLVGHSYGGMVISGVADRLTDRIRRLVYVNASSTTPTSNWQSPPSPSSTCIRTRHSPTRSR
jgi:pimeloyl-ACP methyl ester carboxylesterase